MFCPYIWKDHILHKCILMLNVILVFWQDVEVSSSGCWQLNVHLDTVVSSPPIQHSYWKVTHSGRGQLLFTWECEMCVSRNLNSEQSLWAVIQEDFSHDTHITIPGLNLTLTLMNCLLTGVYFITSYAYWWRGERKGWPRQVAYFSSMLLAIVYH